MLEDVDELMPAKLGCGLAESVIPPSEETDIAKNLSLLLSRDEEIEVLRSLSSWNPVEERLTIPPIERLAKTVKDQQR